MNWSPSESETAWISTASVVVGEPGQKCADFISRLQCDSRFPIRLLPKDYYKLVKTSSNIIGVVFYITAAVVLKLNIIYIFQPSYSQ